MIRAVMLACALLGAAPCGAASMTMSIRGGADAPAAWIE